MTAWGAGSLVQMVSTIQSSRTAETVVDQKHAVSAGILDAYQRQNNVGHLAQSFFCKSRVRQTLQAKIFILGFTGVQRGR